MRREGWKERGRKKKKKRKRRRGEEEGEGEWRRKKEREEEKKEEEEGMSKLRGGGQDRGGRIWKKILEKHEVEDVPGDGHCFYHTIRRELKRRGIKQELWEVDRLRTEVVEEIKGGRRGEIEALGEEAKKESIEQIEGGIGKSTVARRNWGGYMEGAIIASIMSIQIRIYGNNGEWEGCAEEKWEKENEVEREEWRKQIRKKEWREAVAWEEKVRRRARKTISIYHSGSHFQIIREKKGRKK